MKSKQPKVWGFLNPWKKILTSKKRKDRLKKSVLFGLAISNVAFAATAAYYFRNYDPREVNLVLGIIYGIGAQYGLGLVYFYLDRWVNKRQAPVGALVVSSITVCWLIGSNFLRFPSQYYWLGAMGVWLTALPLSAFLLGTFSKKKSSKTFLNLAFMLGSVGSLTLVVGFYWLTYVGSPEEATLPPAPPKRGTQLSLTDPTSNGTFGVKTFSYGSGESKRRKEFAKEVKFVTPTVDGSRIIPAWKGDKHKGREKYWGFGPKKLPVNGLVWMPEGAGPFPIVLTVHGNHSMLEYSDPGYAYLGEWMASNGIIMVSADENFLNGSPDGDFGGKEMPARGWLLLKHLQQWKQWNENKTHELFGKVDLDRVALIGHSRGGEAVSIAAAFNELPAFPDNALEAFDFHFGIKGVIALAQTDYRYERRMELKGVNFLALQGSLDSDEDSFYGLRQYRRTELTDSTFKTGVLIQGANHGQFNTIWGANDAGPPYSYLLNKTPLVDGEIQRKTAKVMIGAFLKTALFDQADYRAVFRNRWFADNWLPKNNISVVYQDNQIAMLEDFESDIDIESFGNGKSEADSFKVFREELMQYKGKLFQENNALLLGWQLDSASGSTATYKVSFPNGLGEAFNPSRFVFDLSHGDKDLLDSIKGELTPDFRIVFKDSVGNIFERQLADYHVLAPRAASHYFKSDKMTKDRFNVFWEPQFEYVEIDVSDAELNWSGLIEISFEFGKPSKGIVYLDNIGFRH
ncbi:MAG: hypothetical protein ACMVP2_24505 [Imperialibacter sp.]|uniref:hypothetical protein n=1 Tax=Imperialibacter sp. TaxID=2038411 RepID=UPI003A878D44